MRNKYVITCIIHTMQSVLVIVESATKKNTISKYLKELFDNVNFTVEASSGHICDVVVENFGIDKTTFQPIYKTLDDKKKVIQKLKELTKKSDLVLLASDNDREGEAIAWHLKNVLNPKKYKRIVFNEITKNAIHNAMKNQKDIDMHMVESQKTRRILDRLVGFSLSNVLKKTYKYNGTLSAGRVQSVVLGIIVEREKAIAEFNSEKYWNVLGNFQFDINDAKLYHKDNILKLQNETAIKSVLEKMKDISIFDVSSKTFKDIIEKPEKPFTTSTLQQKASSIGLSIKETMKVAQELYELGHITYMRTDSTNISNVVEQQIREYVEKTFGKNNLAKPISDASGTHKQKHAQEAHEAIRPTKLVRNISKLTPKQTNLYNLIFNRTVAYYMVSAKYKELSLKISKEPILKDMYFLGKTKQLIEKGFYLVYDQTTETNKKKSEVLTQEQIEAKFQRLNNLTTVKPIQIIGNCIWTSPPTRYSEATIIKQMETNGIGRPSTYVNIVSKLYERKFVSKTEMKGPEKEYVDFILSNKQIKTKNFKKELFIQKGALVSTEIGNIVSDYLSTNFKDIINIEFTKQMEEDLDEISNGHGKKTYINTIKSFHDYIIKKCSEKTATIQRGSKQELANYRMEMNVNGKDIVVRDARYGSVIEIPASGKEQKSKFVPLSAFIKQKDDVHDIKDITKEHVAFLLKFPVKYKDYIIQYKAYGFYLEKNNKTQTISAKYIPYLERQDYSFVEKIFEKNNNNKK